MASDVPLGGGGRPCERETRGEVGGDETTMVRWMWRLIVHLSIDGELTVSVVYSTSDASMMAGQVHHASLFTHSEYWGYRDDLDISNSSSSVLSQYRIKRRFHRSRTHHIIGSERSPMCNV